MGNKNHSKSVCYGHLYDEPVKISSTARCFLETLPPRERRCCQELIRWWWSYSNSEKAERNCPGNQGPSQEPYVFSSAVGIRCSFCAYSFQNLCITSMLEGCMRGPPVCSLMQCLSSAAVLAVNRNYVIMCWNFGLSNEISREENCLQALQT